ncbi:hypothetical protein LOTGIDRAFT_165121 [Lottia gigantea]|uniref:Uncharacterized protein n=1 Tax=Lottia gigantea TaxID=225164 RepID=V4BLI0_LOTGI|nr:hypothetical protein LOTGIDRAFT_165121 [Lottia gigantea]ESO89529.1 hypothetical protein LOTGIDRAFT_165121 [Lottia gigantea]
MGEVERKDREKRARGNMTTIDSGKPPLPRIALGVTLRKSQGETEEDFERRTQKLNEFRDYKRMNFPQENLVLPEKPLLTNSYQQRRQFRRKMILTNGSLRPFTTTINGTASNIMPVSSGVAVMDTGVSESIVGRSTSTSPVSDLTAMASATSTSPALSFEQEDKELQKKLEERNPVIDMSVYVIPRGILDLSKYFIQADVNSDHQVDVNSDHQVDVNSDHQVDVNFDHQVDVNSKKIAGEILQDLLDNFDLGEENVNLACQNDSSEADEDEHELEFYVHYWLLGSNGKWPPFLYHKCTTWLYPEQRRKYDICIDSRRQIDNHL